MNTTQANTAFPTPAPFFRRPHRSVFDRFELTWDSKVVRTNFQPEPAEKTYDEQNSALILDAQPATSVLLSAESHMQSWLPAKGTIWLKWPGEVGYPGSSASSSSASNLSASSLAGANASPSAGSLQIHAYADVVNGEVDSSLFQNKIVLVGPTLTGVDTLRTPFQQSNPINGVYFYAATINNLLNQSFLRRPGSEANLLLLCLLAMVGAHFLRRQGVYWRLAVVAGFPLLWATLAYVGFVMGWRILGGNAGRGVVQSIGNASTATVASVFWCLLIWSGELMLTRSMRLLYNGPIEALQDMAVEAIEYIKLIATPEIIIALLVGTFVTAVLTEGAAKRWA